MPIPMTAAEVLDREFLAIRTRLIDIAAMLDRIDRGEGATPQDRRIDQIRRSLDVLAGEEPGRAERLQLIFSLPYDEKWQDD
jgi:hypothetical protein